MKGIADSGVAGLVRSARDSRTSIRDQHAAFARLVERFEQMAFTTALAATDDAESARDACQEAFLQAWRKLPALREPSAFGGWLRRLVRTQCARERRRFSSRARRAATPEDTSREGSDLAEMVGHREIQALVREAVASLPRAECQAIILFYFLGEPLRVIARTLGVTEGRAGRLVYDARLRLRRGLPRSVTSPFRMTAPTLSMTRRVHAGLLDELAGEYRFAERPNHRVILRREGDILAGYAGGQRNVLVATRPDVLAAAEFDGEARFSRNRGGRISHFVYYEFGRRLSVANKLTGRSGC
jgi:RNA polymerase sigma-70 factor (ECF subfamily)